MIAGGELRDPLAVALQATDVGAQGPVDLRDCAGELVGAGVEEFLHPGEGHACIGEHADPHEPHHGGRVVAPVAGLVTVGLGEQADLVIVPTVRTVTPA